MNTKLRSAPGSRRVRELLLMWGLFWLCFSFHAWQSYSIDPQASIDAEYYHILADRLLAGKGFTEPFIWHHLRPYSSIEHPIDYWMPMGSILYAGARRLAGPAGEIGLNHLLWAVLSVLVFRIARRTTGRPLLALFAWFFVAAGGKFAFYVSTTDNVVFYAVFGFLLLEALSARDATGAATGAERPVGWLAGAAAGLMALTRAEGLLFFAFGVGFLAARRHWRQALVALLVGSAILAPWVVRNQEVLGKPWTSQPRALWVRDYNDMFEPAGPASFAELRSHLGLRSMLTQRLEALRGNFRDFFLIPAHLLFLPLWLLGALRRPRLHRSLVLAPPLALWLLVSILFPAQSRNGIGLHVSVAFFPHIAILCAEALAWLSAGAGGPTFRLLGRRPLLSLIIAWTVVFSILGNRLSTRNYLAETAPYAEVLPLPGDGVGLLTPPVASTDPIRIYGRTGFPGVCIPPSRANQAIAFAGQYDCSSVFLDNAIRSFDPGSLEKPGWHVIASTSRMIVLVRKDMVE